MLIGRMTRRDAPCRSLASLPACSPPETPERVRSEVADARALLPKATRYLDPPVAIRTFGMLARRSLSAWVRTRRRCVRIDRTGARPSATHRREPPDNREDAHREREEQEQARRERTVVREIRECPQRGRASKRPKRTRKAPPTSRTNRIVRGKRRPKAVTCSSAASMTAAPMSISAIGSSLSMARRVPHGDQGSLKISLRRPRRRFLDRKRRHSPPPCPFLSPGRRSERSGVSSRRLLGRRSLLVRYRPVTEEGVLLGISREACCVNRDCAKANVDVAGLQILDGQA